MLDCQLFDALNFVFEQFDLPVALPEFESGQLRQELVVEAHVTLVFVSFV